MACVKECISERESKRFEEGHQSYIIIFIISLVRVYVEFKKYNNNIYRYMEYVMQEVDLCLDQVYNF